MQKRNLKAVIAITPLSPNRRSGKQWYYTRVVADGNALERIDPF